MTHPPPTQTRPTPAEIARTRETAFQLLQAAQSAYDAALTAHEDFRTHTWLPTPRRRRQPLLTQKQDLAEAVTRTRLQRDATLTDPLTLTTLTATQREQATHLSRQGRRLIERAHAVPPSHPAYAPHSGGGAQDV